MLRILNMQIPYKYNVGISAEQLFADNACFIFEVEAPLLWWADFSGERILYNISTNVRGTIVSGTIFLPYKDIIEICEDYVSGYYTKSDFGIKREWTDFCETLLDIKGVRDLVQEEV